MFGIRIVYLLAAMTLACATTRKTSDTAPQPGAVSDDPDDRMICRRERVIGHYGKKRVCKTASERKRDRAAAQAAMQQTAPPEQTLDNQ